MQGKIDEVFKDSKMLTNLTIFFLYAYSLLSIINMGFGINELIIWKNVENGLIFESEALVSVALYSEYQLVNNYFGVFTLLISLILVLTWIYKANKNARSLGTENMKFTPVWSISWYFIPFFNLIRPYQAMKELYQTSVNSHDWKNVNSTKILPYWWTAWLLTLFISTRSVNGESVSEYINQALIWASSSFFEFLSGVLLAIIIKKIYDNQLKLYKSKMLSV